MTQEHREQYDLLMETVIVSLETAGYHMGYLAHACDKLSMKDDSDDCEEYCKVIKTISSRIKKLRKKIRKS